jgi:3-methylfumaryl-CoA hydratase
LQVDDSKIGAIDIDHLREWIGKSEMRSDQVTLTPIAALSATLDRDDATPSGGDPLPPLWHWLYFVPIHRQSELGSDGHVKRGRFIPPVPLPCRMFAGGRLWFHRMLRAGDNIYRVSRIADVYQKAGRSGPLIFVVVRHEISNDDGLALIEEHDIVYRDHGQGSEAAQKSQSAPTKALWTREILADSIMLFRYSALTFNPHRIHYDLPYANLEGYHGLVVHAPLIATLLADLLRRNLPDAIVTSFSFRAVRPLLDTQPFSLCGGAERSGKTVHLWAKSADGWTAMNVTATLA